MVQVRICIVYIFRYLRVSSPLGIPFGAQSVCVGL